MLQSKLSNMVHGLLSADDALFFEYLPTLWFSLLKFFRMLILESASSGNILNELIDYILRSTYIIHLYCK